MCGISGFAGINDYHAKLMLTIGLGMGIDDRGGDAAGYVSLSKESFNYAKKGGLWSNSRLRFLKTAARGDLCMMHARFATCGNKSIEEAHPFAIKRDNKVVLWGAHNGVIPDAWESAFMRDRSIDVDSQELFHLIADKDYQGLNELSGYGVVTWMEAADPHHVNFARLSDHSDMCLVSLTTGGFAWASTWKILSKALAMAKLEAKNEITVDEVGRVYQIHADKVIKTEQDNVKVGSYFSSKKFGFNFAYSDLSEKSKYELELAELFERWSEETYRGE